MDRQAARPETGRARPSAPRLGLLALAALVSCGREQPTAPSAYTLTGPITVTGFLVNHAAQPGGSRVATTADGLPIELLKGTQVVATTTSVEGVYRFTGLVPGGYQVRSTVFNLTDTTRPLTIVSWNLTVGDTLRLVSAGDLLPVPNPADSLTRIFYSLQETLWVHIRITQMGGQQVRRLIRSRRFPGLNQINWNSLDDEGRLAPPSIYWVAMDASRESLGTVTERRTQLLFK